MMFVSNQMMGSVHTQVQQSKQKNFFFIFHSQMAEVNRAEDLIEKLQLITQADIQLDDDKKANTSSPIEEANIKPSKVQRANSVFELIDTENITYPDLMLHTKNQQIKLLKAYINQFMNRKIIIPAAVIKVIYKHLSISAIIGCYVLSGSFYKGITYHQYVYSLEIKSDLTFELNGGNIQSYDSDSSWCGPEEYGFAYQIKGFCQIKKYNQYDLLFKSNKFEQDFNVESRMKDLFNLIFANNKDREKVYQQRILKLYKSKGKLSIKQIKKLHKKHVQQRDYDEQKRENKKQNKKQKKDDVPLILRVLTRKIVDDIENKKLNIELCKKDKKKNQKSKRTKLKSDPHSIYKYLCEHFKVKPLPLSLGNFTAKFTKNGKVVVIEANGQNLFKHTGRKLNNGQVKMKRVTKNEMIASWKKNCGYIHQTTVRNWYG